MIDPLGRDSSALLLPDSGVEFIVPFPYSSNIERDSEGYFVPRLSVLSQMAIDSAVQVWKVNPEASIVIPGETCYPEGFPDTTDLMIARAKEVADTPDDKLIGLHELSSGRHLNNTHLQAEALAAYLAANDIRHNVLTLALGYHRTRVEQATQVRGIVTDYATVEEVLAIYGQDEYEKYLPFINQLGRSERMLLALGRIDRKGFVVNLLESRLGARLVDIVPDENGELTVENETSAKKLARLTS